MSRGRPLEERFWERVRRAGPDECWEWTGGTILSGRHIRYGRISLGGRGGKQDLTHRVAWTLAYGEVPPHMKVCHSCDNGLCVNPAHLFIGTQSDNMRDAIAKNRFVFAPRRPGEQNPAAKFTNAQAAQIAGSILKQEELAAIFGVSQSTISEIKNRRRYYR